MKGLDVARTMPQRWPVQDLRKRSYMSTAVQSSIILSDEGDKDEDDTTRLIDLIALAKAGLQAEEAGDDTGRLSELIALVEEGL